MAIARIPDASPTLERRAAFLVLVGLAAVCGVACGPEPGSGDSGPDGDVSDAGSVASLCERSSDCDDGLFCNGVETCSPGSDTSDLRGCEVGAAPCGDVACEEASDRCAQEGCDEPDADGDGHDRVACGGDDCDDDDGNRFPGNTEVCDEEHDEDCNLATIGGPEGDADGDGLIETRCGNRQVDGSLLRGPDCSVEVIGDGLGTDEHCSACGDSCQFSCGGGSCDDAVTLASGVRTMCALVGSGRVYCWGSDATGLLGPNHAAPFSTRPFRVAGFPTESSATSIAAYGQRGMAVVGGDVWEWGEGDPQPRNTSVGGLGGGARFIPVMTSVSAGEAHACGLTETDRVFCWGDGEDASVGVPRTGVGQLRGYPVGPGEVTSLSSGRAHSCVVSEGAVWCWGVNNRGQVGAGSIGTDAGQPVRLALPAAAVAVSAVEDATCALDVDGGVQCWGDNGFWQGGASSPTSIETPQPVGLGEAGSSLFTHGLTACVGIGDQLRCWGSNDRGMLADGDANAHDVCLSSTVPGRTVRCAAEPVPTLLSGVVAMAGNAPRPTPFIASPVHACAISSDGVVCWGTNEDGVLGDGSTEGRVEPTTVSSPTE